MARYVFFFQAAGMEEIPTPEDSKRNAMVAQLENYGFRTDLLSSSRYCKDAFEKLSQDDQIKVKEIVKTILLKYKGAIRKLNGKSIDEVVEKDLFNIFKELKRANTVYLIKEIEKLIHGK
ncbi:MAG: hypothetical protein NTZ95_03420 [Candidatus Omnitrophica bacterium]|nr:hypothetical protein [Candidatus Omnitrophota bacterium]